MSKIIDTWFAQNDITQRIDEHVTFSEEYTIIYETTDNAFEHFYYHSIPIPAKKIGSTMNFNGWESDVFKLTKKKILLLKGEHYLSLSFRRFFNITLYSTKYYSDTNEIYGKMDLDENLWSKSKKYYILTDALNEYLQYTNQILIFVICSYRYSERELKDFETIRGEYKNYRTNYSLWFTEITDRSSVSPFHSRIKSMSVVKGKYFVPI